MLFLRGCRFKRKLAKVEFNGIGIIAFLARHDPDGLRALIRNPADADAILIQRRRAVQAANYLNGNGRAFNPGRAAVDGKVIAAVFPGAVSAGIVSNILQCAGNAFGVDSNIFLKITYGLPEEIYRVSDVGVNVYG